MIVDGFGPTNLPLFLKKIERELSVIMSCPLNDIKKPILDVCVATNYRQLLNMPQWLKIVTTQLVKSWQLNQFSRAVQQLYQQ